MNYISGEEVLKIFEEGGEAGAYVEVALLNDYLGNIYEDRTDAKEKINPIEPDEFLFLDYTDHGGGLPSLYGFYGSDLVEDAIEIGLDPEEIEGYFYEDSNLPRKYLFIVKKVK